MKVVLFHVKQGKMKSKTYQTAAKLDKFVGLVELKVASCCEQCKLSQSLLEHHATTL